MLQNDEAAVVSEQPSEEFKLMGRSFHSGRFHFALCLFLGNEKTLKAESADGGSHAVHVNERSRPTEFPA